MKKIFLLVFSVCLGLGLSAQDAGKDLKKVKSLLNGFNMDPAKIDNLAEASGLFKSILGDSEVGNTYKAKQLIASVYSEMVTSDQTNLIKATIDKPRFPDAVSNAYKAWSSAFGIAEKKYEKSESLDGIQENAKFLNNIGFAKYEAKDHDGALMLFEQTLEADALLKENGKDGLLSTDSAYQNQIFISSVMATSAGENTKAESFLKELIEVDYQDPLVYSNLYKLYEKSDPDKAVKYLEAGREAFPDDVNMLFTEINYYLKSGRLEELTEKLKTAIQAEPNNASVRSTLGNVYDQLYQKSTEEGNVEKANEYFASAETYYGEALSLDQESLESNYSIGALYYNKAVLHVKEMNVLADDYSKEGTKKYDAKKAEAMSEFDRALPFFEKAYSINGKDRNTLIALKEIYVRKDMLDKSNEMKEQLEAIGG